RAACGCFQTGSRIALVKRSDQRVELSGRDQCLVSPAEHAIGLTRCRCQDERRDREVSCAGCARDPLLARWVGAHLDPSSPGSHTPIVRYLYGAHKEQLSSPTAAASFRGRLCPYKSRNGSSAYASTSPWRRRKAATRRRPSASSALACSRSCAWKKRVTSSSNGTSASQAARAAKPVGPWLGSNSSPEVATPPSTSTSCASRR